MRKTLLGILFLALLAVAMVMQVSATVLETGNGAPSGPHYNLNLIGMAKEKVGEMDNNNGHRIFVKMWGKTRILLQEGDFAVIDADGTDGTAKFQLPDPYPDDAEVAVYRVFIRALGKPDGSADMWSGFIDEYGNEWISLEVIHLSRGKGKSTFVDVTKELTTIYVDMDLDGEPEQYKLFGEELWTYFWDYDNKGLRIAQLRFYPVLE